MNNVCIPTTKKSTKIGKDIIFTLQKLQVAQILEEKNGSLTIIHGQFHSHSGNNSENSKMFYFNSTKLHIFLPNLKLGAANTMPPYFINKKCIQ